MSGFVARLTMDDGSVVVWEPADPAVISVAEQVDVGEHIGSLVAAAPGKTYPKSLVVDNVKSVQYAPGVYRDPVEAAAHARGVADERARWLAAIEATEHPGHCETCCASNLAAMAPSSPSGDRGGPEGGGGV